jgi:glutamine---fructose-6-phosphate transaminase (isomerizing)
MCGIFGLTIRQEAGLDAAQIQAVLKQVASLSESRGKDSSGLVLKDDATDHFSVFKGPIQLNKLFAKREVAGAIRDATSKTARGGQALAAIGHSRLATNGSNSNDDNNQPIVKSGIVAIHNGIIVNESELWTQNPDLTRTSEIDTEIMLDLVRKKLSAGENPSGALAKTLAQLSGTVSTAMFLEDYPYLLLASNNRSLYYLTDHKNILSFASEEYFLNNVQETLSGYGLNGLTIHQIMPGEIVLQNLNDFAIHNSRTTEKSPPEAKNNQNFSFEIKNFENVKPGLELVLDPAVIAVQPFASEHRKILECNHERIDKLKRCSKCILPETFPFIEYDQAGVCNYCNNYKVKFKGRKNSVDEILKVVEPYRSKDGGYDCIIPYSGGRDSTHTLHIAKNELGLNPIAFTYDWGMVTDLARRNIARVCGKLGVENIIVSADIAKKRNNIRMNILAWLKKPHLGMAPLFMAGDKYFFYYTDQVRKQTGIRLNIWGTNPLENTDFKVGFLGVQPDFDKKRIYSLSFKRQMKLFASVGGIMLNNPSYLNSSLIDTFGSFFSRSIAKRSDYYHLYDYVRWDEDEIEDLVLNEYNWEKAIDTDTTWRIGDGTAAFYNYIYYTAAGFSEYDTFRSNQIREGMLSREEALRIVEEENRPRHASLKWYLDIVGIDYTVAIKTINNIPKLYE